jgi:uncharacterized membrane protein
MESKTESPQRKIRVDKRITVGVGPERLYRFWRNAENIPFLMRHIKRVERLDDIRARWIAQGPAGIKVDWVSKITRDVENQRIDWRSEAGAKLPNSGSVILKEVPGDQGTEVRVILRYDPPGGLLGATLAKLLGKDPGRQVSDGLHRLKQMMETGETHQILTDAPSGDIEKGDPPPR